MANKLSKLQANVRVTIVNPKSKASSVFGKGIADLCTGVKEVGSLNAAAKNMGMAYSKAWRIIKDTESALGVTLLKRDGARGSVLTNDALKLLDIYNALCDKLTDEAAKLYKKKAD